VAEPIRHNEQESAPQTFLHFDGMTWPNPAALDEIGRRIVHGTPSRGDLLVAQSVFGAYCQLVVDPQRRRNEKIKGLRAAMEAAE
jgi:hypothetical protein